LTYMAASKLTKSPDDHGIVLSHSHSQFHLAGTKCNSQKGQI